MMRWLVRALLICLAAVLFISACVGFWFFIYSTDLPDFRALARYAPADDTRVSDPCLQGESIAIPFDAIGYNLRAALNAAEGHERTGRVVVRMQISRSMFCAPSRILQQEIKEWRVAEQLRWRFSQNQLLTIYANRVWFGEDCTGVEAAAQHYFHKEPNQLNIAGAALLAGLIHQPSYLSPDKHPDRALGRRNKVIDAMVADSSINAQQGEAAKVAGLGLAAK